jgi:hypothetical protein
LKPVRDHAMTKPMPTNLLVLSVLQHVESERAAGGDI